MEIVLAIIGSIVLPFIFWFFSPESLKKKLRFGKNKSANGSLRFLIRLGQLSNDYWDEVDKPFVTNHIQPFQEKCSQHFQISIQKFVDDVDPSFDITIISELNSSAVIHRVGVEIESIAHEAKGYGMAQAAKIEQQASYTAHIPDIWTEVKSAKERFPRLLEPMRISRSISVDTPDMFRIESESTLRYELLLKNYVAHMPNYAILRFWVQTQHHRYTSEPVHVFTL